MENLKSILIVEDDPFLTEIYVSKLEPRGYSIDAARDGEEALELLKTKRFDLVVLDINLPKISGWDVLREIRNNPNTHDLKVIVVSNFENEDQQLAEELGVKKFIIKIYHTPEEIAQEIEQELAT